MISDSELLVTFARTNSEDTFAELVKRHVNLVYSTALRQVNGDEHFARDVAQTVFTDLACKAGSLARRESLTGWLYTSAHFAAAKIVRTETRRRDREETFMRETENSGTGVSPVQSAPDLDWEILRPLLDTAMHELKAADREAILLRYFENRQFAEVGARLGLNENAARMRVERALEKLRAILAQRGIAATATLASVISAHAVQLAPAGLATTLTTTSILTAGTGTLTLLKIMTATKLKLSISALVVAGAATAFVLQHQTQEKLRTDYATLSQQLAQLKTDNDSLSNRLATVGDSKKLTEGQLAELLKLRGEVGQLRQQAGELAKIKQQVQAASSRIAASPGPGTTLTPDEQAKLIEFHTVNAIKQLGLAMRIYAGDNNNQYATNFDQLKDVLSGVTNFAGNISLNSIEFVNAGLVNETMPDMIIFRERQPRRLPPDGPWQRIYGLADGSAQTIYSPSENFDEFEKPRLVPPPQN